MADLILSLDPTTVARQIESVGTSISNLGKGLNQFKRKKDGGNKTLDKLPQLLSQAIEKSVQETVAYAYEDLVSSTPRDSIWLASRWQHSQGGSPPGGTIATPPRGPYPRGPMFEEPPGLDQSSINWQLPQYIYNDAEYAERNFFDYEGELASKDWGTFIGQEFETGVYFEDAFNRAIGTF